MKFGTAQNLLSARAGDRRVTIGVETPDELRALSDARQLLCPGCSGSVILHAGTVRAHHFAHLPGAVCTLPVTEPETEEHRAGKLLLARWLRERMPLADVLLEAYLPETDQRADVLLTQRQEKENGADRRIALEFQCANLSSREWQRRHALYRAAGIEDLWFLGGSRLHYQFHTQDAKATTPGATAARFDTSSIRPSVLLISSELERAVLTAGAPLLFLDAAGAHYDAGALARFRPTRVEKGLKLPGALHIRPLLDLEFPWNLLHWPKTGNGELPHIDSDAEKAFDGVQRNVSPEASSHTVWTWLATRYHITPETLDGFFGAPLPGQEAFACELRLWQAAIYYRFVHNQQNTGWWLPSIEAWSRAYLPLARPVMLKRLQTALRELQELLAAAGMLSAPGGSGRKHARVLADLTTLTVPPDRDETLRLVRYRRTLLRDNGPSFR